MRTNRRRILLKFELVKHFTRLRLICVGCGYCKQHFVIATVRDGIEKGATLCAECLREISNLSPLGGQIMENLRTLYKAEVEVPDFCDWQIAEAQQAEMADEHED